MGRLFWKFFFFIWVAQLTTLVAVSTFFWWEHQRREQRWQQGQPADFRPAPPPGPDSGPPPRRPSRMPLEPLVGGLLGSVVFAALLARHFARPIRNLRAAFDAAAAGDLEVRVGTAMGSRRDELAELGRDFDRMVGQLQSLVNGQRRLLHDVSHELRSPLARLQAATGLARQQPGKIEASLDRIEKESVRIDGLVGELLTLSRLEAGTGQIRRERIELGELVAGIVDDARFEARARDVEVLLAATAEAAVEGDPELLQRAIENVVRNAVKFTVPGTQVRVACQIHAGEASIRVEDAGPGVDEADLPHIFEPFYRAASDGGGHGLGLAIAHRVVESTGGRLRAANLAEGGLRVEILLPVLGG